MTSRPAVDFLQALLEEREFDAAGSKVVMCVHEALPRDVPLLREAALRFGGKLFDLTDEDWEWPAGEVVAARGDYINGIIGDPAASPIPAPLAFYETDGRVLARLDLDIETPPEPSLKLILHAASIMASTVLDGVDFLVICADTSTADPVRKELLRSILTASLEHLDVKSDVTLVLILDGRVNPDFDYDRTPEIRYVVRWDRLLRRSNRTTAVEVRQIASTPGPVVLFLGAGASASSTIPLGNTYRDQALTELLGRPSDGGESLSDMFFDYLHEKRRNLPSDSLDRELFRESLTLERVLRETFHRLGNGSRATSPLIQTIELDCARALDYERPGRLAIRALAKLLPSRLVLVTVNFDQLIESDLGVETELMYDNEAFAAGVPKIGSYFNGETHAIPVLKLHGSIEDPDSLIANIETTAAGLDSEVRLVLDELINQAPGPLTWLWVGCSMRDLDVNAWLKGLGNRALNEWWVDPLPGESLDSFILDQRAALWDQDSHRLSDRLIIDSADRFLNAFAASVAAVEGAGSSHAGD